MKRFIKILTIVTVISIVFCLYGCEKGKSEEDYKSAISMHMRNEHNCGVGSYITFNIRSEGGAYAELNAQVQLEMGVPYEMRTDISVDKDCNISSCSLCDLGIL